MPTTANNNTDTPTFTGNTNAEPGSEVTISVTDANGDTQVINAVVQDDGSFSGTPDTALAEGEYSVVTEVTDAAGNTTSTTSTGSVDTTAPTVTDNTTPNSNTDTPTFTGNSNAEPGSEVTITVTDANGDSQVINAVVQEDGTYSGSPANALAEGEYSVVTEVTDAAGNTTSTTSTGSVDTTAPTVTDTTTPNNNTDTPTFTGNSNAEPGSEVTITVTDANGDSQVINAVVQEDGTYSGSPANALAEGEYSVVTEVTDAAGNTTSTTSTGSVDTTAPTVTDTTTPNNNTDTPTFTGNSNAEPGSEVTITVTDANGDSQVINAVVQEDGTYSGSPANALAEGEYSVVTEVTDAAGNTTSTTSTGSVDTTAPTVTDTTTPNNNTDTPTFTGNSNAEPGSEVTITVTDANGDSQVINAVVQEDGTYSGTPANALAEGEFTVVTQVTDEAGNTTSTTSTGSVDTTAPTVTDTTTPNNNTDTPIITGNTNAEPGSEVTITVTDANGDSQVINAVVQEDGTYSGTPANALAEGEFTVVTQVTDEAGNTSTQTTTGSVDTQAPNLSVDAPDNSNDPTPTITGTTDAPVNATVNLTVTGSDGAVQTLSASVQANGTYSAEVPVDLAEGSYTVEASVADEVGNEANASDTGNIDTAAPLLTINTPDVSNDDTPIISGTTDNAPGTEVNLVVTDSDGISQTLVASVQSDGTFSIEIATPLADGPYTLNASTEDEAGNVTNVTANSEVNSALPNLTIDALPSGNDATPLISGNTDAPEGSSVNIIVTDDNGSIQTLNTSVQNDGSFSLEVPVALADGGYSVEVTVSDGSGNQASVSGTGNVDTTAPILSVDAPDNSNDATPTISGTTDAPVNSTVNLTVTGSNGAIQTLTAEVQANGTFTADVPVDLAEGNYTVAATVADEVGNEASASDTGSVDTQAPNLTVDAPDNSSDATPTITGTTDAPVNATVNLTVTGSDGAVQTLSASVQANGTYSVDVPTDLAEGNYSVAATVADAAGNEADASDTGSVDTQAPVLTVDAPDNSSDATPTITGTTTEPENSVISILVTDADGIEQTLSATVQSGGTYSIEVPADLAEGSYTAQASVTDTAGNLTSVTDVGSVDTLYPNLTVDAPDNSNDATPTISGTTNAPEGSTVQVTVTDNGGNVQVLTTQVLNDGTYSIDVPDALPEGNYNVEVNVSDEAGNQATISDTGSVDTVAPGISVDAPDNSSDATPSITGTTSTAPVGATVTITVTGSDSAVQNLTATVQSDGSFHVDVPVALEEGSYTVEATVADAAGNTATDSDTGSVDTQAPTLSIVAPDNSNDATPTITGSTDEPENATVSILVTDAQGVEQTLSATVQSDGSFSVDVPNDLAQGNYTVQASITDTAGNSTTESDTGSIDTVAPSLTVEAPDNSSDATPTITGTTNEPDNAIVSITVTGNNGVVQTFDTTVMDNAFSVDVPSDLVDGNYTVSATITDASGNSTTESDTGSVDTVAPSISVDAPDNSSDATPSITGTTSTAPVGATVTITVTGSDSAVQNLTATVQSDGSFHVDVPVALEEGSYTVEATVADAAGNTATDSDTGSVDTQAPTLSIVAPDNSNDATPTITGSTDEPENATVSILVTDAQGVEQTLSATVQSDGSFSVDVPSDLAQGNYTVQASITDAAGNSTTESDTGSIDTVAPSLTVEAPDNSSDATPTITGTTDEPDNAIVSITVTGNNGVVQTFDTTVMDNAFSVDVPSDLVDGNYTVSATITDASGNSTTESDTGSVDTVAPGISVDAPDNSSDATPSITGTTSTAPVGATVTITVTGSDSVVQNLTATVQPDGSFHVDVPVALEEGSYTVEATVADAAGNTATDSDTGSVDTQAPTLSIVAPDNSNDATPTITGNTNEPENATVSILVTDSQGVEQTLSATVQSDGSFSVDVPNDLAQGTYNVTATISDNAGNETTVSQAGSVDTVPPTLVVNAPDNTNDTTPTITGSTDVAPGSAVNITLTDSNSDTQTFSALVQTDGHFSVEVPSVVAEGNFSVSATVSDVANNSTTVIDNGSVDSTVPNLTLTAPANTNDDTPTLSGTTDASLDGSTVNITVTDSQGATQNLTTTVQPDGSFSLDVPGSLADGNYSVIATLDDGNGNVASVSESGNIDTTAPSLSLVIPSGADDTTPLISGSTNAGPGSSVTITVTDGQGTLRTSAPQCKKMEVTQLKCPLN
ncbi:Ig-like domain-containing protein [Paraglaciecola sp. Hal342]